MTVLKAPLAAIAIVAGLSGTVSAAQAMPVAPLAQPAGIQSADFRDDGTPASDLLVQVRDGCGRGWHAGRWGRCVPNGYGPRRVYGPRVYYRPHVYYGRPWHHRFYGYGPRPWYR